MKPEQLQIIESFAIGNNVFSIVPMDTERITVMPASWPTLETASINSFVYSEIFDGIPCKAIQVLHM